jgi:putative hydrolase of HD superfamily
MADPSPASTVDVLTHLYGLKSTPRAGWLLRGIPRDVCESVGDHSLLMAFTAWMLPETGIDVARTMKIAMAHDMAEAITGDWTPDEVAARGRDEKRRQEKAAVDTILAPLQGGSGHAKAIAAEIRSAYEEYEAAATKEARYVKDLDKFEMIMQAMLYEKQQGKDLSTFFESVKGKFTTPHVRALAAEVVARRQVQGSTSSNVSGSSNSAVITGTTSAVTSESPAWVWAIGGVAAGALATIGIQRLLRNR